jgi:transcriptional regulator with XRE-family HTH domain
MTDIIKQLRKIRRDKELHQEAVAAAAGLCQNHISQLEVGRRTPTLPTLNLWANALGYEVVLQEKKS